ncbi:MAG: type II secretion system F family protein [Epsilonproteobacteria bacterium]|nr:hypothetical protein [Campylobacterota bacterium]NPA56398.1 type II secretion system F family protein [Campylobacterota bacterium]
MGIFVVKYYDTRNGVIDFDEIEAESEEEIITEILRYKKNLVLLDIRQRGKLRGLFLTFQRINLKELEDFCFHVGKSIEIGIDIVQAIDDFAEHASSQKMRYLLKKIVQDLENGTSFSNSIKKYRDFPRNLVAMTEVSEMTGTLSQTLIEYADYIRWLLKLRASIKKALTYPIIVVIVMSITISVMLFWVLPKILEVFNSLKLPEMPLPTKILIYVTNHKIIFVYFILTIIATLFTIKILVWWREDFRYLRDKYILNLPIFGRLIFLNHLVENLKTIRDMYRTGSSLVKGIELICKELEQNLYIRERFDEIYRSINNGYSLSEAFQRSGIFSKLILRTITIGESTGKLDESLQRAIEVYEEEIRNTLERLTTMIEPALQVILGGILGLVAAGVLMPIYEIITNLGG